MDLPPLCFISFSAVLLYHVEVDARRLYCSWLSRESLVNSVVTGLITEALLLLIVICNSVQWVEHI